MTAFAEKYGKTALVAGASEGLGAAFARYLAAAGMDLVLVARRPEPLEKLAEELKKNYAVAVQCISCDLADANAAYHIAAATEGKTIGLLVYNAALSYIGKFEDCSEAENLRIAQANMLTPLGLVQAFGKPMLERKKGGIVLMASLAGFQGSGFLSAYAATKAYNRILAESLWYEWKNRGIDVMACCAGATGTPNYISTNPGKTSAFAPKVQQPEEVVNECFKKFGKKPSVITGRGNRLASFFMQKIMPRKTAINTMGDTTRKMYRL